ncbi:MAG: NUDIX domain-containing protein [Chitinophagia bacterium]|nr:NUDIX domain-containing protein [Chitinophagia bacterium]
MKVLVQSTRRVYDGFFKIDEATLQHETFTGEMSPVITRLNFERGDSVAVLVYVPKEQKVVMVTQFRYPGHVKGSSFITEIVAGAIDKGETAEEAARREVQEETGIHLYELQPLGRFFLSPGGSSERITIFIGLTNSLPEAATGGMVHENEDLKIEVIPVAMLRDMMANGAIEDAKTIIACQHLFSHFLVA